MKQKRLRYGSERNCRHFYNWEFNRNKKLVIEKLKLEITALLRIVKNSKKREESR